MLIQALIPEFAVEALNECVLYRCAGLDEPQGNAGSFGPVEHRFRGTLRAVVVHDFLRKPYTGGLRPYE